MKSNTFFSGLLITASILGFNANAIADEDGLKAMQTAKVSLVQAIKAAEDNSQGKAIKAELELEKDKPLFEVDVAVEGKIFEVKVDGETGRVISSKED